MFLGAGIQIREKKTNSWYNLSLPVIAGCWKVLGPLGLQWGGM